MPSRGKVKRAAELFGHLSGTTRLGILAILRKEGAVAVQAIADKLHMTHSAVSHQLMQLSGACIVQSKRAGRLQLYSMSNTLEGQRAQRLLEAAGV